MKRDDPSASPGTTIVGGQPEGGRREPLQQVPVGLEQLLYTAALDAEFRDQLITSDNRDQLAEARGFSLTDSECAVLEVAPADQLKAMIDRIDTSAENLERRSFMRAVAATVVTLAAGTGLEACSGADEAAGQQQGSGAPFSGPNQGTVEVQQPAPPPAGIRPDPEPPPPPPKDAGPPAQHVAPEKPTTVPLRPPDAPTRGIRPDRDPVLVEPPPRATKGSRPDRH